MGIVWHIGKTVLAAASFAALMLFAVYLVSPDVFIWLMHNLGAAVKLGVEEFVKGLN